MATLIRTNTNKYKSNFKKELNNHLLQYSDNYCENINDLLLCFNNEFNHEYNKKFYPNLVTRLEEFLRGLPYGFSFQYKYQILDFACIVHELKEVPKNKQQIIIDNFYKHCAQMILKVGNKTTINEL